ncbi:uncharacterized, partial [Tachysurus ichikawai]
AEKEPSPVLIEFVLVAPPPGHAPSPTDTESDLGAEPSREPGADV